MPKFPTEIFFPIVWDQIPSQKPIVLVQQPYEVKEGLKALQKHKSRQKVRPFVAPMTPQQKNSHLPWPSALNSVGAGASLLFFSPQGQSSPTIFNDLRLVQVIFKSEKPKKKPFSQNPISH
jgi:hypothetical protein